VPLAPEIYVIGMEFLHTQSGGPFPDRLGVYDTISILVGFFCERS